MINHVVISLLCVNEVIFLCKKGGIQTAQEVGSKITVLNLIGSISAALSCLACVPTEQRGWWSSLSTWVKGNDFCFELISERLKISGFHYKYIFWPYGMYFGMYLSTNWGKNIFSTL